MTTENSKSYVGYLNKLLSEYKNTYHRSIGENLIHTDYSALTEQIESTHKASIFTVFYRVRITFKIYQRLHQKLQQKKDL